MSPEGHQPRGPPSPTPSSATMSSSGDSAQKPKRARTSKPKVKTGCNNCKQRRIKCDEKRPSCTQCVRSKKICAGYPPPPRSARPHEVLRIAPRPSQDTGAPSAASTPALQPVQPVQLAPSRRVTKYQRRNTPPQTPVTQHSVMTLYRPSSLPFSEHEGLYFQLFQTHTASELSGYFDSVFWSRTVLQECHSEAAIRHAVVALGALYKTLEKTSESPPGSPCDQVEQPIDNAFRHWEVAIKQYSNACNALVSVGGQDSRSNRTRLMASVLLACFDSFIGDHKQAIVQIQNGLALLEQLRAQRRRAFLPKPEEPVEDELIQMFTRLAIQAKSYDMAFHFPKPYVIRLIPPSSDPSSPPSDGGSPVSTHQDPIPERFPSLLEARLAWDTLCERIFRFTETLFSYASANGPMGVLPASLRQYGLGFKSQIQAWSDAFDHILASRTAPGVSSQEKSGIAVLKMFQIMGQILFLMTFSDTEMQFDVFQPQFKAIVELALEVVGDEERRAAEKRCPDPRMCQHHRRHATDIFGGHEYTASHIKPSFSADLGIVPPLYVVATKCRNPLIRRQAIQLLRSSSRREGMWDSELTSRIGMWILDIEEGDDLLQTAGESPKDVKSARPSTSGSSPRPRQSPGAMEFGEIPVGPGGNARWDPRRESQVPNIVRPLQTAITEERRVMVRAAEFDLREHTATLQCGSRGLPTGSPDLKTRVTRITW
ncbi:Transcriptional regulatory protein moc3 [Pleurostoma richardsiae]|uniref:Transcriptional regulatory protein moc3 n=1 Tax=Pleurostoma richardsiae TaxID=41990 RepID=A0AA38VR83_9PEZI|nr:Transcriptional regulatory protein moc3 [Pleurostoma richardsiae]